MTKPYSTVHDNEGMCEMCNKPETKSLPQQTYPVQLAGMGWGTMWLCSACRVVAETRDIGRRVTVPEITPSHRGGLEDPPSNVRSTMVASVCESAIAWARADRDADDRAADLQGLERAIANAGTPVPIELLNARARAADALRAACQLEERAEYEWKERAHTLLELEEPSGEASL